MIWELSDDTADAELLTTAYRALLHPLAGAIFEQAAASPTQTAGHVSKGGSLGDPALR